jgi:aminopeptidase N
MSGRTVSLQIFVEDVNHDKCDHALISLKKAMRWDEEAYGREYDLDIFMIVAVSDFNMGAMENKGLNIFNSACVLAKPETATDFDHDNIESIIGHEYFHNWSGNRVTCRDWFQLSLKEGFTVFRDQEFTADQMSRAVKRISDVNVLRTAQFTEDAGPMAHPVRPDSYYEINNFYTVTVYNKGAEVVRMLQTLLGRERFRRGTDLYFSRHDGQAVTTDDFVKAMEDANGVDFTQFKRWYTQAGTPVVKVSGRYDAAQKQFTVDVEQSCAPTPGQTAKEPFHIPFAIGLLDRQGRDMPLMTSAAESTAPATRVLDIKNNKQSFTFHQVATKPVPSLLRHFSAPVKVQYDYSEEELLFLMANDSDEFNRWDAAQRVSVQVIRNLVSAVQTNKALTVSDDYLRAFGKILRDTKLDKLFITQALTLPNEIYLAETYDIVDPDAIHKARNWLVRRMADFLHEQFDEIYRANCSSGEYKFNAADMGARSLKNQCLYYLLQRQDSADHALAMMQLTEADNMTDAWGAMNSLVHTLSAERDEALDWFYEKWWHDPLVLDKWFSLQATADVASVIDDVRELARHAKFDIKNPNRVRSVVGSFAMRNPAHFHHLSGAGYAFLADQVIVLAKLNPQIAARLVSAFNQWRRYDNKRQQLMQGELQRIAREPGLPKDVFEIVNKALGLV